MKNLTFSILFSRPWIRLLVLIVAFIATISSLFSPYYQKEFIDSLLHKSSLISSYKSTLYFIALAVFFSIFAQTITFTNKLICYYEASRVQRWLSEKLYSKTLSLTNKSQSKISIGEIISIYASDGITASTLIDDILPNFISYIIPIILAPIAVHLISKINSLPIFLTIFSILAFNFILAARQGSMFLNYKRLAAARIGIVNEWLNNMRSIRILGWTTLFEQKIIKARKAETLNRLNMVTNGSTLNSISYSSPFFINLIAVYFLIKAEGKLITPGEIFSLLWIFGVILTRPMRMLPMLFVTVSDCYTSIKRVEKYLNTESEAEVAVIPTCANRITAPSEFAIMTKNLSLEINGRQLLKNISLNIKQGEFIAIVGEVGSGKSLLFNALLGFLQCQFEECKINGLDIESLSLQERRQIFAYVPQDLFIMNANLRDNISLNYNTEPIHDSEILKALELAQFNLENEKIPFGLDTEIGERGVNLSGGQKQRLTLARAHYIDRNIILLDDCLSALDVNTEEKINQTLLNGAWQNKTRLLITHRLSIIPYCDRVLLMKNGQINEVH